MNNNGRDKTGKFAPGNPGRPKGAKNKSSIEIKNLLTEFIGANLEDLQSNYDELEPREKLQFFERVLKFVIPQQKEINQTIDVSSLTEKELDTLINKAISHEIQ